LTGLVDSAVVNIRVEWRASLSHNDTTYNTPVTLTQSLKALLPPLPILQPNNPESIIYVSMKCNSMPNAEDTWRGREAVTCRRENLAVVSLTLKLNGIPFLV
jgi:hypothetical protein